MSAGVPAPRVPATAEVLRDVAEQLWPHAEIEPRTHRDRGAPARQELILVPNARSPRMAVPNAAPPAARAMLRFSAASSGRDVFARLALAGLLRAGGARVFGDRLVLRGDLSDSLTERLGEHLGEPVSLSFGVGSARVNRKPVLTVCDRHGHTLGYAKLGTGGLSVADVTREGAALRRVATREWEHLRAPSILLEEDWHDLHLLLLGALRTRPWHAGAGRPPVTAMRELTRAFAQPACPLLQLTWWNDQRTRVALLRDRDRADRTERCLDLIERRWGASAIRVGAWHGDWTPWNMARARRQVLVWDWERFETGVPRGLDLHHYAVNRATYRRGTTPETVVEGLRSAARAAGALEEYPAATLPAALYLVAALGRYLPLSEGPGGELLAPRAEVVITALERWLTEPDRT